MTGVYNLTSIEMNRIKEFLISYMFKFYKSIDKENIKYGNMQEDNRGSYSLKLEDSSGNKYWLYLRFNPGKVLLTKRRYFWEVTLECITIKKVKTSRLKWSDVEKGNVSSLLGFILVNMIKK